MARTNWLDRWIVAVNYAVGLWAIGTRFEPLMTTCSNVDPAEDSDINSDTLDALEACLIGLTADTRNWILSVLAVCVVLVADMLFRVSWFTALVALVSFPVLIALLLWLVVFMRKWRRKPEWSLADRVALALKQGTLSAQSVATLRSLESDSLLRVAFKSFLDA